MAEAFTSGSAVLTPASFNDYNTALQTAVLKATKHAVQLPADIPFHRSVDRAFAKDLDAESSRVLTLANRLLSLVSSTDTSSAKRKGKVRLESEDDVVDNFHSLVVDSMDQLLERADIRLDEFLGRIKPPSITVNPIQPTGPKRNAPPGRLDAALQHAAHLAKPQLRFKQKPDNGNLTIWQPTLKHKFNAQVPLGYNLRDQDNDAELLGPSTQHPYRYEITHTAYPAHMFASAPPVPPRSFADTPFTWVSTPTGLDSMLGKLRGAREIAIDLEHHSYRTFSGFVCLMQISTREEDWVVDTLALRDELEALNEVFTDPRFVKVLHGAASDIIWLQQDFNLYIVNLFDTYHASKVLDFPRHNLATLLEMYCDFTADKKYQLADWRIRPLPEEMLYYARSDTHFLLYIYDNLRNALLDRGQSAAHSASRSAKSPTSVPSSHMHIPPAHAIIREVLSLSEETSLRVFDKEVYDVVEGSGPNGWDTLARKWNKGALMADAPGGGAYAAQRAVFRSVHAWRDKVAREEDESQRYVLSNHHLFVLAEKPPADMAALLSMLQPVPPVIRRRSKELLDIIRDVVKAAQNTVQGALGSSATADVVVGTDAVVSETPAAIAFQEAAGPSTSAASGPVSCISTDLWAHASRVPKVTAESSAFLGSVVATKVEVKNTASLVASKSALFGDASGLVLRQRQSRVSKYATSFREIVTRIHSTLVVAPAVPRLPSCRESPMRDGNDVAKGEMKTQAGDAADAGSGLDGAAEIPFVPAARRAQPEAVGDDAIVVVGQRQPKKRKRMPKGHKGGDEPMEPFDYEAASNILDEETEPETGERDAKKQKKKRVTGYQYGDFPAPPPARSQPQSGNQARTFK